MTHSPEADVLVVGAGLAGLVTATEIANGSKGLLDEVAPRKEK